MPATSHTPAKRTHAGRPSILELVQGLADGSTSSRQLVDSCLARIAEPGGEGLSAFRAVNTAAAVEAAESMDRLRKCGRTPSPFAGIPISVKDLFDVAGEVTLAGSTALIGRAAAAQDATAVARLRAAGFVLIGRTNMTEFAFSGLGLNPHYGTPRNPWDRERGRIPGGSSSGAAVSVTDGMAVAGLGTDTGGSCRIPAAMCGTVGFKPTARRVSRQGVIPLSFSLDSVGSLANTVSCCAVIDSVVADAETGAELPDWPLRAMRIGILRNYVVDGLDNEVANAFDTALARLSAAGASLSDLTIGELESLPSINAKGGLASAEAYSWHRKLLSAHAPEYDPRVRVRIEQGAGQGAADYIEVLQRRRRLIQEVDAMTEAFDAVVYPTVPFVAPTLEALTDDEHYARINALALRNPSITNFLDRCAASIPVHRPGGPPVGMCLMGGTMQDRDLLALAGSVGALLGSVG